MEKYWEVGDPNHEKPPVLEIKPDPNNPMWVLVKYLDLDPNGNLVSIRNGGSHVAVWVLPKGLGVIDSVWGDEEFIQVMRKYSGLSQEIHGQSNGSSFLAPPQITQRVINIANRVLHNGNGKLEIQKV